MNILQLTSTNYLSVGTKYNSKALHITQTALRIATADWYSLLTYKIIKDINSNLRFLVSN